MTQPQFELVTDAGGWRRCLDQLANEARLAIDLEANSMYAYRERICLIQISTPQQDFIVDPLAGLDLSELGEIMTNPDIEKIFHAAEYDLLLMKRQFGWQLNGLFDTMWAARILGYDRYGFASLLEQFYDIQLDKRYQKSNWCQRPLTGDQLGYACMDTHYLFKLRDRLAAELDQNRRSDEAAETFAEQTRVEPTDNGFDPESFWSLNGVQDLSPQEQAVLRACNIFRDEEARRRDQPLFKIFSDRTLMEIAQQTPKSMNDLSHVHGMSRGQLKRYGRELLRVVGEALNDRPPAYPRRKRTSDEVLARYDRLHTWRKLCARERGVESDVIVSRSALWELAYSNPQTLDDLCGLESLGGWRCATYGQEILGVLRSEAGV